MIRQRTFAMPHTYVIIFMIALLTLLLAQVIPAGQFARELDSVSGKEIVVPNSFEYVDGMKSTNVLAILFQFFVSIQVGFTESAQIIFFIIFAYAFIYMYLKNGTFDAMIGATLRRVGNRVEIIIPVCMIAFGILGSTMGMFEEVYGLLPIFISIAIALGYDAILGGAIVYIAVAVGFAAATINPFTIGIAQEVSGVELFSGLAYRLFCFVVFMSISILYVWRYARKIKKDPTKSILHGEQMEIMAISSKEELMEKVFTGRQKICGLLFVFTMGMMLYGVIGWQWYIDQIAALFIVMMLVVGLVSGFTPNQIANYFIEAAKAMMFGALICGLSRTISVVMEQAMIIDTVVFWLSSALQNISGWMSAVGMLFVQNIINFFIPSGSGQAVVTMPILAPLSEQIGLNSQIAVLAYQFGDGFSNIFWPTSVLTMCGLMKMPVNKWYQFITPLFGLLFGAQMLLIIIAVAIGYQ